MNEVMMMPPSTEMIGSVLFVSASLVFATNVLDKYLTSFYARSYPLAEARASSAGDGMSKKLAAI
jgi:hypothetical protein